MADSAAAGYVILAILFHGLSVGGIYALGAASLTVIYGGVRFPNVALGSFLALGAYLVSFLVTNLNLDFFLAVPVGLFLFLPFFLILDKALFSRFYRQQDPALTLLILSLGVFTALNGIYDNLVVRDPQTLITPYSSTTFRIGSFTVNLALILALALELGLTVALLYFMRFSRLGRALRALVQDKEAASLMGVDVMWLSRFAFLLSSAIAAITGMLYALVFSFDPTLTSIGIFFIIMVLVGGPGSVLGGIIIGFAFGFIEALVTFFLTPLLTPFVFYAVLFLTLLFKPQGLFVR